jgi:hypothetical protein
MARLGWQLIHGRSRDYLICDSLMAAGYIPSHGTRRKGRVGRHAHRNLHRRQ